MDARIESGHDDTGNASLPYAAAKESAPADSSAIS